MTFRSSAWVKLDSEIYLWLPFDQIWLLTPLRLRVRDTHDVSELLGPMIYVCLGLESFERTRWREDGFS